MAGAILRLATKCLIGASGLYAFEARAPQMSGALFQNNYQHQMSFPNVTQYDAAIVVNSYSKVLFYDSYTSGCAIFKCKLI